MFSNYYLIMLINDFHCLEHFLIDCCRLCIAFACYNVYRYTDFTSHYNSKRTNAEYNVIFNVCFHFGNISKQSTTTSI